MTIHHLPRFYVYLLLSERGEIYCGFTKCIKRRLKEHNAPSSTGWTRGRRWYLLALKMFPDRYSALLVERQMKKSKYDKHNWIRSTGRLRTLSERYGIQSKHLR